LEKKTVALLFSHINDEFIRKIRVENNKKLVLMKSDNEKKQNNEGKREKHNARKFFDRCFFFFFAFLFTFLFTFFFFYLLISSLFLFFSPLG